MAPVPLLSTSFLLVKIFALIFLYLTSILNTKTKYILFVMTATGSFNVKVCLKIIMKRHRLELLTFCEVFNYFYNFIKHIHVPNNLEK